ncbi:protein-glutamate O-methyltransferase [Desulfocurvus sp.]|uniref:CheR family methyltransferase n=1 Tax=Desulfocurvus sp. TaxID=2871698 RepID=UPI0025C07176|nr:protein-glutamate O-methyltransferase [Desulfocurvus sp.]MCK9240082.1 protein-glutamate O-methyltransferase [Desulfocurvus sp.]
MTGEAARSRDSLQAQGKPRAMSDKDFRRFAEFIGREYGIKLPPSKKTLLEARLQKRLRALGFSDYAQYSEFLFSPQGLDSELCHLIDQVTTNTTDFFREPKHFEFLEARVLPEWHARNRGRTLRVWSAGCSIGAEPYTLAMVLSDFQQANPDFRFAVVATDISRQVLQKAHNAVYTEEQARGVPEATMRKYFMRSKDRSRRLVRLVPEVRRRVEFRWLNFMEDFNFREPHDIIFCRNVIIYFDKPTQHDLLSRFCRTLNPGGYLFIGHSESLAGMSLPLAQAAPTIYRKP